MGVIAPQLTLEPSGVQLSNVYLGFGHQPIQISKTFRDTSFETDAPDYKKYRISGNLFIKQKQEDFDSPLTYFIQSFVDDIPSNPYELLYSDLKEMIPSTVDC
jgi:hypothetical protein